MPTPRAETPHKTWGERHDNLMRLHKWAELILTATDDVENMLHLEQEAGQLRTKIEGYQGQIATAKQAAAAAEAQQRAAEASLTNTQARAETEIRVLNTKIGEVDATAKAAAAKAAREAERVAAELTATHAMLVETQNKEIAALERTKARLEADIKALRERVGAL